VDPRGTATTETVMPPVEEIVRAFAPYGCEILGPPPAL
jgi:hypothetical protein